MTRYGDYAQLLKALCIAQPYLGQTWPKSLSVAAVRCEAGRVFETAILVLVSRKGDPFSSATSFSWSHDRLVCAE